MSLKKNIFFFFAAAATSTDTEQNGVDTSWWLRTSWNNSNIKNNLNLKVIICFYRWSYYVCIVICITLLKCPPLRVTHNLLRSPTDMYNKLDY